MLKSSFLWIFLIAVLIRIVLAFVNREANDNHIEVIQRLLQGLPVTKTSCWECFHPKLYYYLSAFISRIFSLNNSSILIAAQLLSAFFGIATLIFFLLFIKAQKVSSVVKQLIFALVALNPDLTGINVQATNDSAAIFFGTVAVYILWSYLKNPKLIYLLLLTLAVDLAMFSKSSGLVIFIAVAACLGIQIVGILRNRQRLSQCIFHFIIFSIFGLIIIFFQHRTISVVALLKKPLELQSFLGTPIILVRPGITSIADSYFTFRFLDLINTPYITSDITLHRTSLWSQLYGRTYSIHFSNWPPSWSSTDPYIVNLTRMILILAFLPTSLFITGAIRTIVNIILWGFSENSFFELQRNLTFLLILLISIAGLILFSYTYKDFSAMKSIYLYPALLSFTYFLISGIEYMRTKLINHKRIFWTIIGLFILFILLEFTDIAILMHQLILK